MSKAEVKNCPRCEQSFECHSSAMFLCQCNQVDLDEEVMEQLRDHYDDCVCLKCLQQVAEGDDILLG